MAMCDCRDPPWAMRCQHRSMTEDGLRNCVDKGSSVADGIEEEEPNPRYGTGSEVP